MSGYKLVPVDTLKSIHRDLDACQKVIWLAGGFDPAYCEDAQARLKEFDELLAAPAVQGEPSEPTPAFQLGDHVRKTKGSQWKGRVVGTYSTGLTPEGYAVESDTEKGSVQIYPVGALELVAAHRKQEST